MIAKYSAKYYAGHFCEGTGLQGGKTELLRGRSRAYGLPLGSNCDRHASPVSSLQAGLFLSLHTDAHMCTHLDKHRDTQILTLHLPTHKHRDQKKESACVRTHTHSHAHNHTLTMYKHLSTRMRRALGLAEYLGFVFGFAT